jgi:hypothetical protein
LRPGIVAELIGRLNRLARDRGRIPQRAGQQTADGVAERGDVLAQAGKSAFGGAPTEHAEEIDHPAYFSLFTVIPRRGRPRSRPHRRDSTQHE